MPRALSLAAAGLALLVVHPGAEQEAPPQASFRASVDIVDVDVSVLDEFRMPVRGLNLADFTVLEDGRPRPIVAFSEVELPPRQLPSAPWLAEVAPDVNTNEFPREGRLIVILFDRSIAPEEGTRAIEIAEAAVEQLRPGDLAAVVYSLLGVPQNFTADRQRLLAAIRQPRVGLPEQDAGEAGPCECGVCSLESIADVAEAIQGVRQRRKMLFYIGSSISVQSASPQCGPILTSARGRALRAVEVGNITVYAFDPTGIETYSGGAGIRSASQRANLAARGLRRRGNLMVLPDLTGGRALFGNQPATHLPEVFRESTSYYVLGFQPSYSDGQFHEIVVRVGHPNVTLQARRGYNASGGEFPDRPIPVPDVSPQLRNAVAGLWPSTDLPLALSAAPVALPGLRSAAVSVVIGVGSAPAAGDPIEVLVGAYDRRGQAFGYERQTVTPLASAGGGMESYEVHSRLDLGPGRYEIRAAVESPGLQRTGSVYTYVDVPNFAGEFVSLSGVLVGDGRPTPVSLPLALADLVPDPLPVLPTARRTFRRSERPTVFVQAYQGLRRPVMAGYAVAQILDAEGRRVFQQERRTLPESIGANRAMDLSFDLPVRTLDPGHYLFTVEVRNGNDSARRDLRFSVE